MIKMFYDVETTGTDFRKHSIIQLSGIIEKDGEPVESFDFKVRPHPRAQIEPSALKANGRTEEEIMTYPRPAEVHAHFVTLLGKFANKYEKTDKIYQIGYNNRAFDDKFLRMFFELCYDSYIGSWFWSDSQDVLCLASAYLEKRRHMMPNFKLHRVAEELGIPYEKEKLHDAMYDVGLTRQIYRIVTGAEPEPASLFNHYILADEYGTLIKTYKGYAGGLPDGANLISHLRYRSLLFERGEKDSDVFIYDDLL